MYLREQVYVPTQGTRQSSRGRTRVGPGSLLECHHRCPSLRSVVLHFRLRGRVRDGHPTDCKYHLPPHRLFAWMAVSGRWSVGRMFIASSWYYAPHVCHVTPWMPSTARLRVVGINSDTAAGSNFKPLSAPFGTPLHVLGLNLAPRDHNSEGFDATQPLHRLANLAWLLWVSVNTTSVRRGPVTFMHVHASMSPAWLGSGSRLEAHSPCHGGQVEIRERGYGKKGQGAPM